MGVIKMLFGDKNDDALWKEIKIKGDAYPTNSISILMVRTESGKPGTGWVDKGYVNYEYKKFCPYYFLIKVDLTDAIAKLNSDLDMGTIENYFIDNIRNICVSHIVARLVNDKGLSIEIYSETNFLVLRKLQSMQTDNNRLVSFEVAVKKDPKWTVVERLLTL
jgi:hypothetical protein